MRISKDESGTPHIRHRMNPTTGKYRGRIVMDVMAVTAKKATNIENGICTLVTDDLKRKLCRQRLQFALIAA